MDNLDLLQANEDEKLLQDVQNINFDALSPAGQTYFIIKYFPIDDAKYAEVLKTARDVLIAQKEAGAENATPEQKKAFAAAGMDLHVKLGALLSEIKHKDPGRFENDANIENLVTAYNINSNVTVKAAEDVKGDVLEDLGERAFADLLEVGKGENVPYSKDEFEFQLARVLYLGKLKAEYDKVHGNEADQKKWRAEILNEVLSDKFEENVLKMKSDPLFTRITEHFLEQANPELDAVTLKYRIDKAVIEEAEEKYHKVYRFGAYGFKNEYEKQELKTAVSEIEQLQAWGNAIGVKAGEDGVNADFNNHPVFDTKYLMKKTKIFGEQKNLVGELKRAKEEEDSIAERLVYIKKDFVSRFENAHQEKRLALTQKYIDIIVDLKRIEDYVDEINVVKKEMAPLFNIKGKSQKQIQKLVDEKLKRVMELEGKKAEAIRSLRENHTEYSEEYISKALYEYHEYREYDRNYDSLKAAAEKKAEETLRGIVKSNKDLVKRDPSYARVEIDSYNMALIQKNTVQVQRNNESRYYFDSETKKNDKELYKEVTYGGKRYYISRSAVDTEHQMRESYNAYKQAVGKVDENLDAQVEESINAYNQIEAQYEGRPEFVKPVREGQKVLTFAIAKKAVAAEADLNAVQVLPDIEGIAPNAMEVQDLEPLNPGDFVRLNADDLANISKVAFETVEKTSRVFRGTQEYKDILDNLYTIKNSFERGSSNDEKNLERLRLIYAQMNRYIDRKTDEKDDRRKENKNSKKRRESMESSRLLVQKLITALEKRTGQYGKDTSVAEAAADLEAVLGVTKNKDASMKELLENLKSGNREKALTGMYSYLTKNVSRYYRGGKYHTFRLRENGDKKRIPYADEAKIYKTVLLAFEKTENRYLKYLAENEPQKLPGAIFHATHVGESLNHPKTLSGILGIDIKTNQYTPDLAIRESKSPEEHLSQFKNRYVMLVNEAAYRNIDKRGVSGKGYDSKNILSYREQRAMVESALSVYYLKAFAEEKKNNPNREPFRLESVEEERKKFISMLRRSTAYDDIEKKCCSYFDLSRVDDENILASGEKKRSDLIKPDAFKEKIIAGVFAEKIAKDLNHTIEMLGDNTKFDKQSVNTRMNNVAYNMKLARHLGIGNIVEEKAQAKIKEGNLKGNNLEGTVNKTKEALSKKIVNKQAEPTKGIDQLKL